MKNRFFASIAILGVAAISLTSCQSLPQAEIDAANAAIEQAKLAGADVYAQDNFVALQDSLSKVMVAVETENAAFFKNFSKAKESLAGVAQFAGEVKLQAEARKEEIKAEVIAKIAEVKTMIEANRNLILEAPKGKEGTSALVAIGGEVDAIEASINETNTIVENGDFMVALEKVNAAQEKATAINTELTEVIAKYNQNKKGRK